RESDFLPRRSYFMDIQKQAQARIYLRVYSLNLDHPHPHVRVRVQANYEPYSTPWETVYDETHALTAKQRIWTDWQNTVAVPIRPLALQIQIDPLIASLPDNAEIAISVSPAASDLAIWPMVSVTDNVTQRFRLLLPD
ncbi:MAG: hypothetical protein ACTHQM_25730, partial [Thermoanaerobaculia bacterium]